MKGHKRFRSGAWRLAVFAGVDPDTEVVPASVEVEVAVPRLRPAGW
jgi:hypothetical protein